MKFSLTLSIFLLTGPLFNNVINRDLNTEVTENGYTYLYGEINREGLKSKNYVNWFSRNYNAYHPNSTIMNGLKQQSFEDIKIKLLMGTWCGDSKRNVPKFYKIMDEMGFDESKLQVWGLDLRKKGPNSEERTYNVFRVPTIIIYKGDKEIGRFIERLRPGQTLEGILLNIFTKAH